MFPPLALELNLEIVNHYPDLANLLAKYPNRPLEVKLATIAAYCNVAVDGDFREKDLEKLFQLLYYKLKEKRTIIVS